MSRLSAYARRRQMLRRAELQREVARRHRAGLIVLRTIRRAAARNRYRRATNPYKMTRGVMRRDRAFTDFLSRHPRPFRYQYFKVWPRMQQKWYYYNYKQRRLPYAYRRYSNYF
jgi:hypothetical protein